MERMRREEEGRKKMTENQEGDGKGKGIGAGEERRKENRGGREKNGSRESKGRREREALFSMDSSLYPF